VRMLFLAACRHWAEDSDDLRRTRDRRVLGHFHEWQGSLAIPMLGEYRRQVENGGGFSFYIRI